MDSISSVKPFVYTEPDRTSRHRKNTMNIITGIVGTSIPVIHSLAGGMASHGNVAAKATTSLNIAKGWGLFIAGAALFNKAATSIINKIPPLKKISEDHPGITTIGIILTGVEAGRAAIHYGNKALTKLLGNKPIEEKIYGVLDKSSILKNKTVEKIADRLSQFANSTKGRFIGNAAMLGMGALFFKSIFDLGKMDYKISKTKQS